MTAHIEDVLLWMVSQKGDRYIFGAEAKASDPNPSAFDCSELVEWACARAGVTPRMPDGAFNQWKHCTRIPVDQGINTRGALLFVGDGTGWGRNAITHVAASLGDGTTVEARGSKWGVGTWPSVDRFDFAGLIPGGDYTPGHGQLPPAKPAVSHPTLRRGSSGSEVRALQNRLNAHAASDGRLRGTVDGVFGPNTEKRVKFFQHDTGLTQDGVVGPKTWSKLDQAPG